MGDWLQVRNWDKWQTYRRDRATPPWIKVHRRLLADPQFAMLSDAERGALVCIWVLAADRDGKVPADPKALQKLCLLDSEPDVAKLCQLGFLVDGCQPDANLTPERRQDDANVTPTWRQHDAPEAEAEAEAEEIRNTSNSLGTSHSSGAELSADAETRPTEGGTSESVLTFPTAGKSKSWTLTAGKLAEYRESFPSVDVLAECRAALQWVRDNRRKTARGMPRFLASWLTRAQDQPRSRGSPRQQRQDLGPRSCVYDPANDGAEF